ncbi:hypothetical protein NDU88_002569 [Pleurodeles waltl]|uniref:Uncharacterized protein n=1 Tax=Pleurodeles waltl TaxID=8319 RepID=A0AAV7VE20_PLEWA|nr:hypothetical protein NDU88_002569 [Pleurodeles waltl]
MELYTTQALSGQQETCLTGRRTDVGLVTPVIEPTRAELFVTIQGSRDALEGKIESVVVEVNLLRGDLWKVSNRVRITKGSISELRTEVDTPQRQMAEVTSKAGTLKDREDDAEATEAATTHNKEWLLAQIRGARTSQSSTEEPNDSCDSDELGEGQREVSYEADGPKKSCRVTSREGKRLAKKKGGGDNPKTPEESAHSPRKKLRPADEIQIEGLDLAPCNKKEEDRRERPWVKKERNFDNWRDAFRIMACVIVEKFRHCVKDM